MRVSQTTHDEDDDSTKNRSKRPQQPHHHLDQPIERSANPHIRDAKFKGNCSSRLQESSQKQTLPKKEQRRALFQQTTKRVEPTAAPRATRKNHSKANRSQQSKSEHPAVTNQRLLHPIREC